ncbi:SseB family protein [Micromonospora sp. DT233]|uniref:SseB family protein n=1 Tax=Micromonospora sp. DT233 TaxID=3393432 RepID=UPI003CE9F789
MTDWEPATEAEAAMRDALRAQDQELYFRVLARTDLLLPVSTEALAGQAPLGWGTWTTGGRTHVLAFTSPAALQACLGGNPAASRRSAYAELAADWPNHEWWLAVNPGLPIEGYLPAWFVSQLSRGDVRLPGRTMGARARLERAENAARTRATAVVPGRETPPPPSPVPAPPTVGAPPGRPATGPLPAAPPPAPRAPAYRPPADVGGPVTAPPYGSVDGRSVSAAPRTGEQVDGGTGPGAPPVVEGSAWLNVPRRRVPESTPTGAATDGNVRAGERPAPPAQPAGLAQPGQPAAPAQPAHPAAPAQPASFFEPASGRNRAARPLGDPRRPVERAAPPSRFAGGGQPFPRRRPASDPPPEQSPHAARPATPAEPPAAFPPPAAAAFAPPASAAEPIRPDVVGADEATRAFQPGGSGADEATRAFRLGGVVPEEATQALRTGALGDGLRAFRAESAARPARDDAAAPEAATQPLRPGAGGPPEPHRPPAEDEATRAFRPVAAPDEPTHHFGVNAAGAAAEATRPLGRAGGTTRPSGFGGAGTGDEPPRRPGAGAAQAFPRPRPGGIGEEGKRPRPERPVATPIEEVTETPTVTESISGSSSSRRSFSPIVIEGTIIESRDLPATAPASPIGTPDAAAASTTGGGTAQTSFFTPSARAEPVAPEPPTESLFGPAEPLPADSSALDSWAAEPAPVDSSPTEPLSTGSLSTGPAAGGAADREPEPTTPAPEFQPANAVEEDLLAAAGTGSTDTFLSTLLLARVLLPTAPDSAADSRPGEPGFVWRTERLDGERYVVVYTSPERLADHVDEPLETVRVKFVQLIRRWPDDAWSFAVNPNTPVGAKLPGEQIVALASWAAEMGLGDDAGNEPEPPPAAEASPGTVRHVPPPVDPTRPVVMQKAIAPSQLSYYLDRGYDRVSGFVHRANELAHLNTPAQLHDALGLGYPDSPFSRDAEQIYVLRWPAHRPNLYRIPYGGQNEGAMRAMEGWVIERPPFRGNGFAPGESSDVVAEFKVDSARLPHGAQLWRIGAEGTERVVAILDTDALLWRRVGEP